MISSSYSSSFSYSVGTIPTKLCTFELRMRLLQYATTHKIEKIKMTGSRVEMASEMGDNHGNFDLFRLDSSVRIKTRICAEVTKNRICANAHNSDDYETRFKCSQDWSRLGFVSALPHLRLDYALALISYDHCRSSRNNPHYAPRHIIYYNIGLVTKSFRFYPWFSKQVYYYE